MPNIHLFGSRGHLAQTKIIPALKKHGIKGEMMSRSNKTDLSPYVGQKNIMYMSVPSKYFFENIEPYMDFIKDNHPTFVIEKPHENILIHEFAVSNNLKVLYNDHYIAKQDMLSITEPIKHLKYMDIVLHEKDSGKNRKGYEGIFLDMYQSHAVVVMSKVLSLFTNCSRTEILENISQIKPRILSKSDNYCSVVLMYNNVRISVSCGKEMPSTQKIVFVNGVEYMDLSDSDSYDTIVKWLVDDNTKMFLNNYEVMLLWKHIS